MIQRILHVVPAVALAAVASLALALVPAAPAAADEGMWPLNEFPAERFRAEYGFEPSPEWLETVRLGSVRFNNGGSGSFVSADGLVITNHHVGADCIQKLSSAENDYRNDGFVAATPADELPCPDLELNVLDSIERITARVQAAGAGEDDAAAAEARRAERSTIEKECQDATGLRCNVVTLYQGGEYDLYRYRRYTDVRLAFAPEGQLANFGGDPDNFEYPRYCIDFALFRVWDGDAPLTPPAHLEFHGAGPTEGEVAFVSGNPGSTARLDTVAELEWLRDGVYPFIMVRLEAGRDALLDFGGRGAEQARIAQGDLAGVDNSIKAVSGYLSGLLDPELMAAKAAAEQALRQRVAGDPELAAEYGDPWTDVATALAKERSDFPRSQALSGLAGVTLSNYARTIVRLVAELEKPNTERLREYSEAALPSLYQRLYSTAPIYPEYEEFQMVRALRFFLAQYGPVHPLVIEVFGDATAEELAHELIAGTTLGDPDVRRALVEGGTAAVAGSDDPLIRLMRQLDPAMRHSRAFAEDEIDAVLEQAGTRIADAYFAVQGRDTYPDATFSLRLSYGRVIGYEEGGRQVRWHTDFAGMLERAEKYGGEPPYDLAPAVAAARDRLDLSTPVDFVSVHDIIGGNSGSPVVDKQGRFVGIVFDGNLYMLPNRFQYTGTRARAISVHPGAILATLRVLYPGAAHLADELEAGGRD